ncbi:unnamed protein product [Heterobilharzia americana]|nr:unnamed protein product [Heterobilharzia americana]
MGRKNYPRVVEDDYQYGYWPREVQEVVISCPPINRNIANTTASVTTTDFIPVDGFMHYENSSLSTQKARTLEINYYGDCARNDEDDASEYQTALSQIPSRFSYRHLNLISLYDLHVLDCLYYVPYIRRNLTFSNSDQLCQ